MKNNLWNTKNRIDFDEKHKNNILNYYYKIIKFNSKFTLNQHVKERLESNIFLEEESFNYLKNLYDIGYGYKILGREIGLSYSKIRRLLNNFLKIKTRKGYNVVTEKVKKFRSERVKGNKSPFFDWPNQTNKFKNNSRGIQGYFLSKNNEYVWLRSTWEYIYAKWLDKNNINWKFEEKSYKLLNGESYRPDFFIYDKNNNFKNIVEIKGYFKDREYKVKMLKEELFIDVIVIDNINDYCENYNKELYLWKKEKLLKKELKK